MVEKRLLSEAAFPVVLTALIGLFGIALYLVYGELKENRVQISNLAQKVARTEAAVKLLTPEPVPESEIHPTELEDSLFSHNGNNYKVLMSTGIEKEMPVNFKKTFSINTDRKAYFFIFFPGQLGAHNFQLEWIRPDLRLHTFYTHDFLATNADWRGWHSIWLHKELPKGTWYVRVYADSNHIATKSFTITD